MPLFVAGLIGMLLLPAGCAPDHAGGFAGMRHGRLEIDGKPFFPVALNYVADLQWKGDSCWASSAFDYQSEGKFRFNSRAGAHAQLKAEFGLIHRMGFNTIRIVGMTSNLEINPNTGALRHPSRYGWGMDTTYTFEGPRMDRYLDAVADMVSLAGEAGLHVIVLLRLHPDQPLFGQFAFRIVDRLKDHREVLAYDLFNEPLYFDKPHHRPKEVVHRVVKEWRRRIREHAPQQLVTIGLVGVPEVFAWDPNILDVDFISFHPYEYEPEQVRNEIRWYGEHVDKPWMIGETSLPADNDSVPYAEQLAFARKTLDQTIACGGIGYSWWQFKDVKWGRFHSDFMGVMNREGRTPAGQGLPQVEGTPKPVVEAFREFQPGAARGPCAHLPNYRNFSSFNAARLTGRVLDQERRPVEGAVILGWNEDWTSSYYTISRPDGSFALYGDFRFHHWMISATRRAMVRGDIQPGAFLTGSDGVAEYYLGEFALEDLRLDESR